MGAATATRVHVLRDHVSVLWIGATLFFVVGDLATTFVGLNTSHAREIGPLVRVVVESYGLAAVVPLKLGTMLVCVGLWRVVPSPYDVGVPFALTVLGATVTAWNVAVLAGPG